MQLWKVINSSGLIKLVLASNRPLAESVGDGPGKWMSAEDLGELLVTPGRYEITSAIAVKGGQATIRSVIVTIAPAGRHVGA